MQHCPDKPAAETEKNQDQAVEDLVQRVPIHLGEFRLKFGGTARSARCVRNDSSGDNPLDCNCITESLTCDSNSLKFSACTCDDWPSCSTQSRIAVFRSNWDMFSIILAGFRGRSS